MGVGGSAVPAPRRLPPELGERVRPVALAGEQTLPVADALASLLPRGLRRGSAVAVGAERGAGGATSLALAACAGASAAGSWVAAVGLPSLGLVAAAELGIALDRFALVAAPDARTLPTVVATLVDAFDVVLLGGSHRLRAGDGRRLTARVRERGAVLVPVLGHGRPPPLGLEVDATLTVVSARWEGVGDGHGHLRARRVLAEATGRGAAARGRRVDLWLPGPDGEMSIASLATVASVAAEPMAEIRRLREVASA
jgi:hypothetical protein